MKLKQLFLASLLLATAIGLTSALVVGCKTPAGTIAYQSISATETGVIAANAEYLDQVVTGQIPTNGVLTVEAAFNDTQMALHAAAVIASGGASAPTPPATFAKAVAFTNTITANSVKK